MNDNEATIRKILKINNGIVTTTQVTEAGIQRHCLSAMVDSGAIYRVNRAYTRFRKSGKTRCSLYNTDSQKAFFRTKLPYIFMA